ncbi:rhodanese-like domain-containing protein [Bosea sp. 685]|uniref:rhodanese-like domain-containing protein n=1 Tax=Bosea sp. 685 TaxID=3080057 RepID=UPI0028934D8B|nr:rhodanese-like domain-containing protein [Bosea sp. 685]WNJ92213.1 rhodanese-like domain-containing protein [Bosea sp. 685]
MKRGERRPQAAARPLSRRYLLAALASMALAKTARAQSSGTLSAREAYDGVTAGALLIIDIRTPDEWTDTGVPQGALRLDAESAGFEVRLAGIRLDHPGKRIALIDRSGGLAASIQAKLAGRGWRDLVMVRSGMLGPEGWLSEKLPVVP